MLVAAVQRFIRAGHESFSPFDEGGSEKTRDHTDDDFVEKGRVHTFFEADAMPLLYQKPHWCVRIIHNPRRRLVTA